MWKKFPFSLCSLLNSSYLHAVKAVRCVNEQSVLFRGLWLDFWCAGFSLRCNGFLNFKNSAHGLLHTSGLVSHFRTYQIECFHILFSQYFHIFSIGNFCWKLVFSLMYSQMFGAHLFFPKPGKSFYCSDFRMVFCKWCKT